MRERGGDDTYRPIREKERERERKRRHLIKKKQNETAVIYDS
jgi:hypothetical protein